MSLLKLLGLLVVLAGIGAGAAVFVSGLFLWTPAAILPGAFLAWVLWQMRQDRNASRARIEAALKIHDSLEEEAPSGRLRYRRQQTWLGDVDLSRPNPDLPSALDN